MEGKQTIRITFRIARSEKLCLDTIGMRRKILKIVSCSLISKKLNYLKKKTILKKFLPIRLYIKFIKEFFLEC